MQIDFEHQKNKYTFDTKNGFNITISIKKSGNVNCYFLDNPMFQYFENDAFSGDLGKGGSVNCEKITFYPHASGTHTECALHVYPVSFTMLDINLPIFQLGLLKSFEPMAYNNEFCISKEQVLEIENKEQVEVIILRTMPNDVLKLKKNYSDTNPPFISPEAILVLKEKGFKHIVTDLPSIDKESDGGKLLSHKTWFKDDDFNHNTITELVFIDNKIMDGLYVVNIQMPKIETDAVPSNIILYPCV